jgi:vacuolar-type H+-ATPase subunit I/STV1
VDNEPTGAFKPEGQVRGIYDPRTSVGAPAQAQSGQSAEVTIWIDRADVKAATQFVANRVKKRPYSKAINSLVWLVLVVVVFAVFFALHHLQDIPILAGVINYVPAFAGGAITLLVLLQVYQRLWIEPAQRKINEAAMKRATGRFHVAITPESITFENAHRRDITKWSRFTEITANQDVILLFLDPYTIYFIPRNAFANEEEADQFLEQMRTYHRAATEP